MTCRTKLLQRNWKKMSLRFCLFIFRLKKLHFFSQTGLPIRPEWFEAAAEVPSSRSERCQPLWRRTAGKETKHTASEQSNVIKRNVWLQMCVRFPVSKAFYKQCLINLNARRLVGSAPCPCNLPRGWLGHQPGSNFHKISSWNTRGWERLETRKDLRNLRAFFLGITMHFWVCAISMRLNHFSFRFTWHERRSSNSRHSQQVKWLTLQFWPHKQWG